MQFYWFLLGMLGTWRITHFLSAEDGPFEAVARLRRALGNRIGASVLDCFNCMSLLVAAPMAFVVATTGWERALCWLSLSGAAILLERVTTRPATMAPRLYYTEDKESADELLRQGASTAADEQRRTDSH